MVSSDEETVEVGYNDERRMCGMARDDDDDDIREDAEALMGCNIEAPIDVGGDDEEGGVPVTGNKRSRPSTSPVWEDFQKLFKVENGKKVRYGAKCLHCNKEYSALSSGGTGHLRRHRNKCEKKK